MQLRQFQNIEEFWSAAQAYLLQYEAEHNLLLGILHSLRQDPERQNAAYLAIVESAASILAVAVQTPPYKLVLSKVQEADALKLIAMDVSRQPEPPPGVSALITEAEQFVELWQLLTQQSSKLVMQMRIHQLTAVQPVATAPGKLRPATASDRPLLLQWFQEFIDEAIPDFGSDAEKLTDSALKRQSVYLWEDQVPVSFACGSQFLPTAARLGPVYTPRQYRRQGYATACVAALSQHLLDQGCQSCFLFTDLANPTSNHIYQTIGYQPICDWSDYQFIATP